MRFGMREPSIMKSIKARLARYFNCTIGELFDLKEGNNEDYDNCENKLIYLYRKMTDANKCLYIEIGELIKKSQSK